MCCMRRSRADPACIAAAGTAVALPPALIPCATAAHGPRSSATTCRRAAGAAETSTRAGMGPPHTVRRPPAQMLSPFRSRSASIAARTHVAIRVRIRQPSVTPRLACLPLPRDTTPAGRPHPASHREQEQGWRRRHNSTRSCYQTVATQHEHSCHVTAALRQTVKGPAAYTRIRPTGRTVQVSPHDLCKRRVARSARTYPRIRRCNQPSALLVMSA